MEDHDPRSSAPAGPGPALTVPHGPAQAGCRSVLISLFEDLKQEKKALFLFRVNCISAFLSDDSEELAFDGLKLAAGHPSRLMSLAVHPPRNVHSLVIANI